MTFDLILDVIPFCLAIPPKKRPEPFLQLGVQHRDALFGAENTMNIERAKGVGHGRIVFWHFT
jgi:hypothetical protein